VGAPLPRDGYHRHQLAVLSDGMDQARRSGSRKRNDAKRANQALIQAYDVFHGPYANTLTLAKGHRGRPVTAIDCKIALTNRIECHYPWSTANRTQSLRAGPKHGHCEIAVGFLSLKDEVTHESCEYLPWPFWQPLFAGDFLETYIGCSCTTLPHPAALRVS
jgi:hypothetical protein